MVVVLHAVLAPVAQLEILALRRGPNVCRAHVQQLGDFVSRELGLRLVEHHHLFS